MRPNVIVLAGPNGAENQRRHPKYFALRCMLVSS